ncbi:hypothetical protein WCP94_002082 [Bilophila wadsworthia]
MAILPFSRKRRENIRVSLSRHFQPPLRANGECSWRLALLNAFPALSSYTF